MVTLRLRAGLLSRRRAARRAHLRRRDRAAHRAVRLRRGVRVRDDGRGGGDRRQPVACARSWTPAMVPTYGWRIAFVLGGLGGVLSFVLRRSLEESPEFARMREPGVAAAVPRDAADARRRRCSSAARCWPARPASTACSSRTCRRTCRRCCSTTRAQAVLSQTVGVIASSLGILVDGLAWRSHPAALSAARRRRRC